MSLGKIQTFESEILYHSQLRSFLRKCRVGVYNENLGKEVQIPHNLYCKDREELGSFVIGDEIDTGYGFYHNGNFVHE